MATAPSSVASARRVRARSAGLATAMMVLGLATLVTPPSASPAAVTAGYRDFSYSGSITAPTGQKPESKLWFTDGSWWGALWNASIRRMEIHRFNRGSQATHAWTATGAVIDTRRNSEADVLWDQKSSKLYVVTHLKDTDSATTDLGLRFRRFGYNAATNAYSLEVTHDVVSRKVEAAVMDKDSRGRLWVTYTTDNGRGGREVRVAHSTTSDTTWTSPSVPPVAGAGNLSTDDISTLVAYVDPVSSQRSIGVLWSNQSTGSGQGLYFASHRDGSSDSVWTGTRLCQTTRCPDDHLNIKSLTADASGAVFAVVKTSLNDASPAVPTDPLIVVYRLNLSGSWTKSVAWRVADNLTRAIIVLDTANRRVHVFGAAPCCSGGVIYTKQASFDSLAFPTGLGTPFIKSSTDTKINNPTSTKQTVNATTGLLVLAGDDSTRFYLHNLLPLG
ncbi:MAG TPA: hypothetical protein VFJ97_06630 [Dermatophilaceae bacterium]|nr:hypothetical protein [Dermatophilaceae bacterium]